MNALTIGGLILLAVSLALNAVLLPREIRAQRVRKRFYNLLEAYRISDNNE